jgi:hypothetical protein
VENLWKLIKASAETDLHDLSVAAEKEWGEVKDRLESLETELDPDSYVPQEYPKMVGAAVVHNAAEEAKLKAPVEEVAKIATAPSPINPINPPPVIVPIKA